MYGWVEAMLIEHGYVRPVEAVRGLLRRFHA